MRIQCNVCEAAEAKVLCCADEAALCWACDEKVHAANKLASKHQRVPLSSSSSQMPKCDICQEIPGFFFCLQDRALLCRKCDVAIHTANPYVSSHQRFLLTGVKVGLETTTDPGASSSNIKSPSCEKTPETKSNSTSRRGAPMAFTGGYNEVLPSNVGVGNSVPAKVSYAGGSTTGSIQSWQMDDLFGGLTDFNQSYGYMDNGSSKADSGKRGDSDSSLILLSAEEEVDEDERLGQVPESSWAVPQVPSPPTASGLYWPKDSHNQSDGVVFVPDIHSRRTGSIPKRRRQI
ncbi:B-box zinc finger protein 22-like [Durio zibethinus]|uniref:B-box zinc finger protein 22-like n=1 Tax=Durio zibethinus TaxID=66656 RepID=A0A6P5WNN0_DURZI|nr:B-box zinc finger protein 22-like [Durio zibethinus]